MTLTASPRLSAALLTWRSSLPEVRMRALTDWLEAHPADLAKCLRTGEPMVMEFTGATITRDELRGVLAELRNPASPC